MNRNSANLASVNDYDFAELAWEDNKLVMLCQNRTHPRTDSLPAVPPFVDDNQLDYTEAKNVTSNCQDQTRRLENCNSLSSQISSKRCGDQSKMKSMNFSHFVRPSSFIGTTDQVSPGNIETRSNKRTHEETLKIQPVENKKMKATVDQPDNKYRDLGDSLVPDEYSQAYTGNMEDHVRKFTNSDDHQVPRPDTSIAASNDPPCALNTIYEDSDSSYPGEDEEEDWGRDRRTVGASPAGGSNVVNNKKSRTSLHNQSERKRRDKINKKLRTLQELLPNCNKVDKASVLDEAIEYVKTLQFQLQIMSAGTRMFPPMMLPPAMPQIPVPHFNQFSPAGMGMAMRMDSGFSQGPAHQFPVSLFTGLPGFPQMPCMPYMPVLGGGAPLPSIMSVPDLSRSTASINHLASAPPVSASNDSSQPKDFPELGRRSNSR